MVARLVERLPPGAVQSVVVTLDRPGPICARLGAEGVPVHALGDRGFLAATVRLARLLRGGGFDVVNAYGFKGTLAARILTRFAARGRPAFVSGVRGLHVTECESVDSPKARLTLALDRLTSSLVDVYDANSPGALELLAGAGVPREHLRYIPNGIAPKDWPGRVDRSGRSGPPTVLCVARFIPRRRHVDLVQAARMLSDRGVEYRLLLAGDGPTLEPMRELAAGLGIADRVEFPGYLERGVVRDLLVEADVFALVSSWEGMAGTVMEAMASSLPVVGSAVNGIADLVVDGVTGRLAAPESPERLSAVLEELLVDPALRKSMGLAGLPRPEQGVTIERVGAAQKGPLTQPAGRGRCGGNAATAQRPGQGPGRAGANARPTS